MPVSMYSVSIPVFMQHLNGLSGVLDKAAAWAAARKVNEADLLNMRLSPDMFNLTRQIRAATDHAANARRPAVRQGAAQVRQRRDHARAIQGPHRQDHRISQERQAGRGRRHRGQGDQDHLPERPGPRVHRPEPAARQRAAELLFPRHHRLRHHPPVRRRGRQARLHGHAAGVNARRTTKPDARLDAWACEHARKNMASLGSRIRPRRGRSL